MNDSDNHRQAAESPLRAVYRDLAREQVPGHVDRAILSAARQAVESRSALSRLTAWLRPLAFVATAGLSLALIVQLSNAPNIDVPDDMASGVAPVPADAFQDAAGQTAERIRQLGDRPDMSMSTGDAGTAAPAAEAAPEATLLPDNERCSTQARASSGTWWQCIRRLEQQGLPEAAEIELQALLRAFPRFSAPQ